MQSLNKDYEQLKRGIKIAKPGLSLRERFAGYEWMLIREFQMLLFQFLCVRNKNCRHCPFHPADVRKRDCNLRKVFEDMNCVWIQDWKKDPKTEYQPIFRYMNIEEMLRWCEGDGKDTDLCKEIVEMFDFVDRNFMDALTANCEDYFREEWSPFKLTKKEES